MSDKPKFYWNPPDGVPIVSIVNYRDMIVVATTSGIYVIAQSGSAGLDDHTVQQLMFEAPSEAVPKVQW